MEGAAAQPSGASGTDNSVSEGGQEAPLTTTQSGLPIAPVYAGAGFFTGMVRSRKQLFHQTRENYRKPDYAYETRNPYIPPMRSARGGIDMKRNMSGIGVGYTDALDLFKPQKPAINKQSTGIKKRYRQQDPMRRRQQGRAAYIKENPDNKDGV